MICNNCGSELKDNAKFCSECGKAVSMPEIQVDDSRSTNKEDDSEKKQKIIMIEMLVVIIAASILAMFFVPHNNQRTNANVITYDVGDTVPDSLLDTDISYIWEEAGVTEIYTAREYTSTQDVTYEHSPDPEAHLDRVQVKYNYHYYFGTLVYSVYPIYQYYSDSDTWELIRCDEWDTEEVFDYESLIGCGEGDHHTPDFELKDKYEWMVDVEDADEDTVTISYEIYHYYNDDEDMMDWIDTQVFDWNSRHEIRIPCGYIETSGDQEYERSRELVIRFHVWDGIKCHMEGD